jgi:hypothetical protein
MEVFKIEAREIRRRFLGRRLSFPRCIAALDDALADLTSRLMLDQIVPIRLFVLANNEIMMKEMERRGSPKISSTHF